MTTLPRLRAEVARRYAALDLPAWPAPHPDGAPPREEEYSRVTEPQRYRIAAARARVWAEVLAEVGAAVAPDPHRDGAVEVVGLRGDVPLVVVLREHAGEPAASLESTLVHIGLIKIDGTQVYPTSQAQPEAPPAEDASASEADDAIDTATEPAEREPEAQVEEQEPALAASF